MKKRFAFVLALVMLLAFAAPAAAMAAPSENRVCGSVELSIDDCYNPFNIFDRLVHGARLFALRLKVEAANARIASLVRYAQATPYDDVKWLLHEVDVIVADVMADAARIGVTVECEYDEYVIDGQTVLIDPLRVVNVPSGGDENMQN